MKYVLELLSSSERIVWEKDRYLEWIDFQGQQTYSNIKTRANFTLYYDYAITGQNGNPSVSITVQSVLNSNRSWAIEEVRNENNQWKLEFHRALFDLLEETLQENADSITQASVGLADQTNTLNANTEVHHATQLIESRIQPVVDEIMRKFMTKKDELVEKTNCGSNSSAMAEYHKRFENLRI